MLGVSVDWNFIRHIKILDGQKRKLLKHVGRRALPVLLGNLNGL